MRRSVDQVRLDHRSSPAIPVLVHDTGTPGPTVAVTANVHGDETTGTLAAHILDAELSDWLNRGRVVIYPSLNPDGMADGTRTLPDSRADLNRLFPGFPAGTPGQRHAARIWRDLQRWDLSLLIDIHADSVRAVPYAIADRAVGGVINDKAAMRAELSRFARASGLLVLDEYPDDQYVRFRLDRSLAGAMVNHGGTPAVTIEVGPRGWADTDSARVATEAVRGILIEAGLIDGASVTLHDQVAMRRAATPRIRRGGLLVPEVLPGTSFKRGERLARVVSISGDLLDELRAPRNGVVVSWLTVAWVEPGSVVGTLGLEES